MDSDKQSDTEEVRRMAEENRKSIERLREELRRLKVQMEVEDSGDAQPAKRATQ